ncbi:hypothetical protein LT679_13120 [Mucilaginibacter roseus]|uniref:Lipoprotein n=1 Tax=Mucilaginibacter roseus TaxID=1528868 RepID=A0ABS8U6Q3_9SPHI|nr:hypothetical protein [Mucilaginibacter roseus]MCD8741549.1 hypothetical protein [Mucilaginibacter roseus]
MKRPAILILCVFLFGCTSQKQIIFPPPVLSMTELTDFCDLPNHKNEEVYVRGVYSGVDEYWWVTSFTSKCNQKIPNTDLDIPNKIYLGLDQKLRSKLENVHEYYWNRYAIIDMIGTYDDSNPNGYGHLGQNKARFIVKRIIDIQVVLKKKQP